jgi:hypothetical protein
MSEERINADELTKAKKPGDVQLTEEELSKASGGASDYFLQLKGVDGESKD